MRKLIVSLATCSFFMIATSAHAQAVRTWVSGVGDDANPCSRNAPCRTFAGAIPKTAINGEINCLDNHSYGAVTITKSLTIDCQADHAGITASLTNGIIINGAGIVVTLRGLSIDGVATVTGNGVRILQAGSVFITDCQIANFAGTGTGGRGVAIETATANVRVTIQNSQFWNNNNISIHSNPSAGNVILDIDNVQISRGGGSAVQLRQLTNAMINRLSATNHSIGAGVGLELNTAVASIADSFLSNNAFGILVGNGGAPTARVASSLISGNTSAALQITSGLIISSGNNTIRGNAGNEAPSSNAGTQ